MVCRRLCHLETQHSRETDSCFVMPVTNVWYFPRQILHNSLWIDSVVKEHGSIYNTGKKSTAGSRLKMQAVRKDSKDQETFTLQHAGSGRRMEAEVSVVNWETVIWQRFWNTWSWQIMEASGCRLKSCGEFFSIEGVVGTDMCKKRTQFRRMYLLGIKP